VFLTIIIPAYNEEIRLPRTLEQVGTFLAEQQYSAEVLVVNNNSTDRTDDVIQIYADRFPFIRGLFESRPGKGAAVQCGMLAAQGEYTFMCDADLSMPIEELIKFLPPARDGFDLAIASREAAGSIRYDEPVFRYLGGRIMNLLIQLLILPGLKDTQCGFKCFSASAAKDLFKHQTLSGMSFDIELLAIARLRGYRIDEVPISWYFQQGSTVHVIRDALQILKDILSIQRNSAQGLYDPEN
jgi:dolichyl-phosphate beta-glucosyltransferase